MTILAVLNPISLRMITTKNEPYTIVSSSLLEKLGDNASALSELLLFDNIDGDSEGSDADFFFAQKLIKLGADMIVICLSGSLRYVADCNRNVNLQSGQCAVHQEGEIIDFLDADMESKVILITLPHDIGIISHLKDKIIGHHPGVISPEPEIIDELRALYRMMKKKMDQADFIMKEEILNSYLICMLLLVNDTVGRTETNRKYGNALAYDRRMEIYNKFVASVKTNYRSQREVGFYASDICISAGHLARIVKGISGKTAKEWIKDYIILEAKVMLRLKHLPIYQISESLNFPNPSFFSKYFREKEGVSPSQYRVSTLSR